MLVLLLLPPALPLRPLLQGSVDRVVGFVTAIINFYVWLFTTLMGTAQKAFGAVTGEPQ